MKVLLLILRIVFGALFLWSGVAKLKDPILFAESIRHFDLVGDPLGPALALFIPWVELLAGIGIMWDRFAAGSAFLLTASLVIFTGAVGIAWARGLDISCGCFGGTEAMNYPLKMAQNLGLILWGAFLLVVVQRFGLSSNGEKPTVSA